MNRLRRQFLLVVLLLLPGLGAVSQEAPYTLRELAERRGFFIGAAAWTDHLDVPEHAAILAREFNMLTPEHEAKHCMVEWQRGQYDFRAADRLVAFAEEHDMAIHGHTLVWHSCMPSWIQPRAYTRDEAIGLMRDFIKTMVGRYAGRIEIWDVVNEAIADGGGGLRETPWMSLIGEDYIELAFQFAHEADPDAKLFYNDYGIEFMNGKSDATYELVSDLLERGIPIHGVGLQAHFDVGNERAFTGRKHPALCGAWAGSSDHGTRHQIPRRRAECGHPDAADAGLQGGHRDVHRQSGLHGAGGVGRFGPF
jgi:endo-1,4-beta-xylanase